MDNIIVCKFNPSKMYQMIHVPGGTRRRLPTNRAGEELVKLCYSLGITQVNLTGDREYIRGVIQQAKAEELKTYSMNKINFEVY